jgi:hypothetical protein
LPKLGHDGDLPLLTEDDVQKLGAKMENNTSAGVLCIEQLWAKGIKKALLDKDAVLLDEGRIHPDAVTPQQSKISKNYKNKEDLL